MSFLPALTRRICAWPLMRNSLLMIAISRQVSADLLRRELTRTLADDFGTPDQRHDPARQWHLQPVPVGDGGDDTLQIIDFGAAAALQVFPHRRARLGIDLHRAPQQ